MLCLGLLQNNPGLGVGGGTGGSAGPRLVIVEIERRGHGVGVGGLTLLVYLCAWFETFHNIRHLSSEVASKKHESWWALCIDTKSSGWVLGCSETPPGGLCSISGSFTERRLWTGRGRSKGATVKGLQMLTHMSQLRKLGCSAREKGLGGGRQSCSQPHTGCPGLGLCPHTPSGQTLPRGAFGQAFP